MDGQEMAKRSQDSPPSAKRSKFEDVSADWLIRSVLANELTEQVPSETVICALLANQADISTVMRSLVLRLPMQRLQHLKRVRHDRRIILFTQTDFDTELADSGGAELCATLVADLPALSTQNERILLKNLQEMPAEHFNIIVKRYLLYKGLSVPVVDLLCQLASTLQTVAAQPPMLRWQFDHVNAMWPCKFHPNRALENQYNNEVFSASQTVVHQRNQSIVQSISRQSGDRPAGMAIDPRNGRIVAMGIAEPADVHPLMHSAMVLIDAVARSQNSGAWNDWPTTSSTAQANDGCVASLIPPSLCVDGVSLQWRTQIAREFPLAQIGAQPIANQLAAKVAVVNADVSVAATDNLEKYGPYLCIGYDVYLTEEPCMMCAMALVHSRVRTVFYQRSVANGALGTMCKLHTVKALNHHYDVYQICKEYK